MSQRIVITGVGEKKIQAIKELRALTGLGLREAKGIIDSAADGFKAAVEVPSGADLAGLRAYVDIEPYKIAISPADLADVLEAYPADISVGGLRAILRAIAINP